MSFLQKFEFVSTSLDVKFNIHIDSSERVQFFSSSNPKVKNFEECKNIYLSELTLKVCQKYNNNFEFVMQNLFLKSCIDKYIRPIYSSNDERGYLCLCSGVNRTLIREYIKNNPNNTYADFVNDTLVTLLCGECKEVVEKAYWEEFQSIITSFLFFIKDRPILNQYQYVEVVKKLSLVAVENEVEILNIRRDSYIVIRGRPSSLETIKDQFSKVLGKKALVCFAT